MLPSPQSRAESDGLFRPVEPMKSSPSETEGIRNRKEITPSASDGRLVKPIAEAVKPQPSRRTTSTGSYSQNAVEKPGDGMLEAMKGNDVISETRRAGKGRVARALFDSEAAKAAAEIATTDGTVDAGVVVDLPPPNMLGETSLLDTSSASLVSLDSETLGATVLKVGETTTTPATYRRGRKKLPLKSRFNENKLFVGQIPREFEEAHLQELLEEFGPLAFVSILRNGGRSRCCGFATYVNVEDREKAIEALHMKRTLGTMDSPMQLKDANKPKPRDSFTKPTTTRTAKTAVPAKGKTKATASVKILTKHASKEDVLTMPAPPPKLAVTATSTPTKQKQKRASKITLKRSPYFNVYVTMISRSTTKEDLEMMFARHGSIVEISVQVDACQRRCGLVSFSRQADAVAAVAALDRTVKFPDCQTSMVVYFASPHEEKLFGKINDTRNDTRRPERTKSTESGRGSPTGAGTRRTSQTGSGSVGSGTDRRRQSSSSSSSIGSNKSGEQRPRRSGSNSSSSSSSREESNNHSRSRGRLSSNGSGGGGGGRNTQQQQQQIMDGREHMVHSPFPGASPMVVSYHPFSYKNTAPPSPAPDVFGVPTMSIPIQRSMSPATYMYHTQPPPMSPQPPMVESWFGGYQETGPGPYNMNGMMSPQVDYSYQYVPEMVHEIPAPTTPAGAQAVPATIPTVAAVPPAELTKADLGALVENSQQAEQFFGPPTASEK